MNTGDGIESSSSRGLPGSLAGFLEIAFDAVVEFDSQERILSWNPAAEQMFGWTAQEVRGKTPARLFWPVSTPEEKKDRRQRQSRLKRGETLRGEHTSCRRDGSSLDIQYAARALFDAEGKLTGYLAIYRDVSVQGQYITEHKQKEEALRARTEEIETLLEVSPVAIFVAHDPECVRITGNPAGYRMVELPENPELNISKSAPAQERPTYRTFRDGVEVPAQDLPMQKAARLGVEVSEDALELRFEDGSQKFLYAFAKPLFDTHGRSRGAIAAMLDITQHKRSEQLMQESEERFRNIFNQSPIGIGVYDADGVLVNLNRASMEMFGIPSIESVLGLKLFSSPTVQAEAKVKLRNQEQIQEEVVYDFDEVRRLGFYETIKSGISYFNRIITPLRSTSADEPFGYLSQVLDITERKRAEDQLEQSNQKLNDILASIQDDFYVIDRDWIFVYANRQFTSKLGKEPEDLIGNNVWQMFPKHVGMALEENFRAAMEKREIRRFEIPGQYTDAWYSITVFPSLEGITVLGSDITEHKRLQAETESMAKFPQENPNPVLRVNQEGMVLFGNRASQKLLDQWDCSIGTPIPELWREKVTEQFRLGVPGEAMLEWNGRIFLLQLVPILENHYLNIYGRDITERKRAEEQRERSNQKLNEILASIQDDLYVLDRDWTFVYANRLFTSRVGKEPEDFVGNNIWTMFPKHLGTVVEENFRAVMEKREIRRFETRGKYTSAWYRLTAFPSAEGITVLGADITKRKRTEDALRVSEERLRRMIETSLVAIGIGNSTGKIFDANMSFYRLTGYSREEIQASQLGWGKLTPPEYAELDRQMIATLATTGSAGPYEKEYIRKDGSRVPVLLTISKLPRRDEHIAFIMDITERKRSEQALAQALRELQGHINNSPLAIVSFDPEYHITEWSASAERMFGWRADEVLKKTIADLHWVHEDDMQRVASLSADMFAGRMLSNAHANRNYRKDGSVIECEWYNSALPDADGKLISVRSQVLDITDRKRAEEALHENQRQLQLLNETLEQQVQEKTAEVRSLASDLVKAVQHERHRISHILHDDLQQRIYAIRMQLTFLHDELQEEDDDEAARTEVANIEKELADILTITRNLSIDLSPPILRGEGLSHAINWLAAQMRQRYGLPIELQANGPFAISAEELHVLLFNCVRELLFNVVKHAQASRAVVALHWTDAGLRIEVRDDGKGFLVNMPMQQGISEMGEEGDLQSSSGLPTIRHQLSLFDGRMEIQSTPGAGTRIILIVPVAEGE